MPHRLLYLERLLQQSYRISVKLMPESNYRVISYRPNSSADFSSAISTTPQQTRPTRRTTTHRQERELDRLAGVSAAKTVSVSLKQIVPLLIDAAESNLGWLEDFDEDQVRIDTDLYEVLLAYQHMRRRDAA
ncbi:hypothetical protein Q31b_22410 [Novipirellula aureliae]|uniref:Uncharacterized protein n=1 Tax=Novipirellula aureliae TaxID=2527966 RepID=A0A5C6E0I5_9BACT|nr:hypothetical protein [Novipirellula aureliae]TWU43203.1 hypothetical protein Q31b_22410 [Novipirellula aureliae]